MHRRRIGIGFGLSTAIAAVVVIPFASADPTPAGGVTVNRACYVNTAKAAAQITVTGTGWEAGSTVEIADKLGRITATATATSSGTFSVNVPAPVVDTYKQAQVSDAILAYYGTDQTQPSGPTGATATSSPFLTANFAVLQSGNRTDPRRKTTFHLSGFTPNRTVYAHYLSARGRWLANTTLGTASGACGLRQVSTELYPGGQPPFPGTYSVQFDNSRHYSRTTAPQYRLTLKISR